MFLPLPLGLYDWKKKPAHSHYFETVTDPELGHRHPIRGFVYSFNGSSDDGHVHWYQGMTRFVSNHAHRFYGTTGPAIPLPDGSHIHAISGFTHFNYLRPVKMLIGGQLYYGGIQYGSPYATDRHRHSYPGWTGKGIAYTPANW
jgi:hypothetical protein